jgi:hypothetical protein
MDTHSWRTVCATRTSVGEPDLARAAFKVAAEALEAVVARGPAETERAFHRLVAAAAYHLGRYSARAYSLLHKGFAESNLSTIEISLAKLMLRDLDGLARDIANWFSSGVGSDDALIAALTQGVSSQAGGVEEDDEYSDDHLLGALATALDGNFMAAMAAAVLSLERGDETLRLQAQERLKNGP